MSPVRRRQAVGHLMHRFRVSERRACRLVGQHRSTNRYRPQPPEFELRLVKRMNELVDEHPRYGYRRICALLRSEGWEVNEKRIHRLWRLEGHRVPEHRRSSGKRAEGSAAGAAWIVQAICPNHIWSYDFLSTVTADGYPIRVLNIVDEFTRVAVGCRVDRSIGARDVIAELERTFRAHGKPQLLRSDNGREFIAASLASWLQGQGVGQVFIEKGSPQQNPFVERFNRTMRDELLNGESFHSLLEAKVVVARWLEQYNTLRPHRGLGMKTPAVFASESRVGSQ